MPESNQPNSKFKPGDYVHYDGRLWKIDGYCKTWGEDAYDISTVNSGARLITPVPIKTGDEYFRKA